MLQKDLNEENKEINDIAYALYEKHGFKDGNQFVDWLEAERLTGKQARIVRNNQFRNILYTIVFLLAVIISILLVMLLREAPKLEVSDKSMAQIHGYMAQPAPQPVAASQPPVEKVLVFGDTHFEYGKSALALDAKSILDDNIQMLKDNPQVKVRMAGYTSANGSEKINQKLSETRAQSVREYLIKQGVDPKRLTIIGYGQSKPASYEKSPKTIDSKAAKANMRVLFEVVVK
ncbi:MAG: OmpA family protein [bacterium]|nr:OmpA family protein [bacterium]